MAEQLAIGIVPHTGWAWAVALRGPGAAPTVVERDRLRVEQVVGAELYHRAAAEPNPEAWLREATDDAAVATERAVRAFIQVFARNDERAGAAVVVGKPPPPPRALDRVLAAHPAMHAAEGELWRALFAEACADCGLRVVRATLGEPRPDAPAATVDRWLRETGRALGPPWTKELRQAATAAWSLLAD